MLLGVRIPLLIAPLGVLLALAGLLALGSGADRPASGGGGERVLAIRAESAPLVAADVAQFQARRRELGQPYARDTRTLVVAWLGQFEPRERRGMRDWTRYHGLRAGAGRDGFVVETSSGPGASGWFRLSVNARLRRVSASCGGTPAPGCSGGRWRPQELGHAPRYLLPR